MPREILHDLIAFIAVARERSFTRAAAQLGISQSTLSHTIRSLEKRLAIQLLTRTTRSVAPTEAGERLLHSLAPRFAEIEAEVAAVGEFRDKPAGTIRITATDYAANTILWPRLSPVLSEHPGLNVEISIDYALRDIVQDGFDLGVRSGDQVAKDMVAVRIGPPRRMVLVASPTYLSGRPVPTTPRDLTAHNCINMRLPTHGGLLAWELEHRGEALQVRVEGQVIVGNTYQKLEAVLTGLGIAILPEDLAQPHVAAGRLQMLMEEWCATLPGQFAYYPQRREARRALQVVVDALRWRD